MDALRGYKHGRTLADLAVALDVSERTVRRDIADLVDAEIRIELTRIDGRSAARLIEPSYAAVPVTRRERYTLLAVRHVFDVLRGTPLHDDVISVLDKVEQRMNPTERTEHAALGAHFAYVPDGELAATADDTILGIERDEFPEPRVGTARASDFSTRVGRRGLGRDQGQLRLLLDVDAGSAPSLSLGRPCGRCRVIAGEEAARMLGL